MATARQVDGGPCRRVRRSWQSAAPILATVASLLLTNCGTESRGLHQQPRSDVGPRGAGPQPVAPTADSAETAKLRQLSSGQLRSLVGTGVTVTFKSSNWSPEFYCDGTYAFASHPANMDGEYHIDSNEICFRYIRRELCFPVFRDASGRRLFSRNPFLAAASPTSLEEIAVTPNSNHRCANGG